MRFLLAILSGAWLLSAVLATPMDAQAKPPNTWIGRVSHVSTENIKVVDRTGHELSFLLVPKFKQIFSADGKTTYQMAEIKPGMNVKIYYSQKVGLRHADKIIILNPMGPVRKSMKS